MLLSLVCGLLSLSSFTLALPTSHATLERRDAYNAPRLVNYVQTFHDVAGNPLSLLPLLNENTGITHVNLAALHINSDASDITLNDNNPNSSYWDSVWSDVKQLQAGGIKVLFMLGGAAAGSYPRLCGSAVPAVIDETYYGVLRDTIRAHDIDGMDLDIEESVDMTCALALLQRLNADFGSDFILTMAPVASAMWPDGPGLSGFDYPTLDAQATDASRPNGKLVDWYNAQFYNGWGDASTQTFYDAIITMGGWSPDRVVMGVLDSSGDGGSGFVPIKTLESVILQLRANYANFGCAVGWEYWDAGTTDSPAFEYPWQWVQAVSSAVSGDQTLPAKNLTSSPLPNPAAPFPSLTETLVHLGAEWLWAVWALNVTDGNLLEAEQLLNLTSLL
ncbi:hypothetical protein LTR85_007395 [Meristemomyces frigidus]|nr:hypothetical protein LTR85_007395 [Meristemomyces frigidus]